MKSRTNNLLGLMTLKSFLLIACWGIVACATNAEEEFDASDVCPESGRGSFVDERNGWEYKWTTIGGQVWMAENLRYAPIGDSVLNPITGKNEWLSVGCLYSEDDCSQHGYVYAWSTAIYACPEGWHLPSIAEWKRLFRNMGGMDIAGYRLKSAEGWRPLNPGEEPNGIDACGFRMLPSKAYSDFPYGYDSYVWTSDYGHSSCVYHAEFQSYSDGVEFRCTLGFKHVRCIKD